MSQGILGFKYEEEKHDTGMTGLAGLPVYLDLLHAMGMPELIGRDLQVKQRGWTDAQMVLSLMLMNISGGDCVEDLSKVEKDEGFCRILRRVEQTGLRRSERRDLERRWPKERWRSVPSASAVFRYLSAFHDLDQEGKRKEWMRLSIVTLRSGRRWDRWIFPACRSRSFPFRRCRGIFSVTSCLAGVTNMDWDGERLIHWHRERCGKSEEAHSVMKGDFAGGKLPSGILVRMPPGGGS